MNKKSGTSKDAADKLVRGIKRKTGKHYCAEEKIRIVLVGLRGEESIAALADRSPRPRSVWNRIPDQVRNDVVDFALEHEDLTPRELAVKYTDEKRSFVSESSVYRILSAEDLITAPTHVVICAANEFRDKTTRLNELWQTDFTYLKAIG